MPTQTLVDREIGQGRMLVDAIAETGFRLKAAFWYFGTEFERWRLLIQFAGLNSDFDQKDVYKRIEIVRRSLGGTFQLPLHNVVIQSQHSPLVKTVRHKLAERPGPKEGFHYIGERVGIDFIEDVYIYLI